MLNIQNIAVDADSAALSSWLNGAQQIVSKHMAENYPNNPVARLELEFGRKYIKVWAVEPGSKRIHAFIDASNGDVLKPAGCKAPAKHARGNIFDAQNGLGSMGPWGPAYLK